MELSRPNRALTIAIVQLTLTTAHIHLMGPHFSLGWVAKAQPVDR